MGRRDVMQVRPVMLVCLPDTVVYGSGMHPQCILGLRRLCPRKPIRIPGGKKMVFPWNDAELEETEPEIELPRTTTQKQLLQNKVVK